LEKLSLPENFPVLFDNDAICFSKGEVLRNLQGKYCRVLSITLGTGLGACFIENNKIITDDKRIPEEGTLYNVPYRHGIAEEYISNRALVLRYYHLTGKKVDNGKQLFDLAMEGNEPAKQAFADMGMAMAEVLIPWIKRFEPECLIIGGKIGNASEFFLPAFNKKIQDENIIIDIHISSDNEASALVGAAGLLVEEMGVMKNFGSFS
jgi:glucokinase